MRKLTFLMLASVSLPALALAACDRAPPAPVPAPPSQGDDSTRPDRGECHPAPGTQCP